VSIWRWLLRNGRPPNGKPKPPSPTQECVLRAMAAGATLTYWWGEGRRVYATLRTPCGQDLCQPLRISTVDALEERGWIRSADLSRDAAEYQLTDGGRAALDGEGVRDEAR
jgi:hypothetical protein